MSSLGDKSQCIGMIADIEGIVDCIDKKLDQKLDELIFSPNPLALPVGQDISTDPQVQLNFAPVAAPQ